MLSVNDIKWGEYKDFEGPVFHGKTKMAAPPASAPESHRIVHLMTQTEGGSFSAVNMYDKCYSSVGIFQFCEGKYHLTSRLLGVLLEAEPALKTYLGPALQQAGADFKKNAAGKWRFFMGGVEVTTEAQQKKLFFKNASGLKNSWDDDSKAYAKLWAASFANLLEDSRGHDAQTGYCADFVMNFATKDAKALLFNSALPSTGWVGATRAIYLSYAGNLPSVADKHLKIALGATKAKAWSKDWCLDIAKELAFGPQITIFPGRYDKIRPWVERYYGVDLPDFSSELQIWRTAMGGPEASFESVCEIQEFLLTQGFDLGPAKADGVMGRKTRDALIAFQKANGLKADGQIGPKTRAKMLEVSGSS